MFPPKNVSKIIFFSFKIPGKIPKINFSEFENLALKIVNYKVFPPLTIFQGKMEIFKFFSSFNMFPKKIFRKFFLISKLPAKFPKLIFPNLKI
jgi:hypothetical protein